MKTKLTGNWAKESQKDHPCMMQARATEITAEHFEAMLAVAKQSSQNAMAVAMVELGEPSPVYQSDVPNAIQRELDFPHVVIDYDEYCQLDEHSKAYLLTDERTLVVSPASYAAVCQCRDKRRKDLDHTRCSAYLQTCDRMYLEGEQSRIQQIGAVACRVFNVLEVKEKVCLS